MVDGGEIERRRREQQGRCDLGDVGGRQQRFLEFLCQASNKVSRTSNKSVLCRERALVDQDEDTIHPSTGSSSFTRPGQVNQVRQPKSTDEWSELLEKRTVEVLDRQIQVLDGILIDGR